MLNEAINYWYSGHITEAYELFSKIYIQLDQYPVEASKSVGQFFHEQQMKEQAIRCYERYLQFQFDEQIVEKYIDVITDQPHERNRLLHILHFYENRCSANLLMLFIGRLQAIEDYAVAYNIALHALTKLELQFVRTGELTTQHCAIIDIIVANDVSNGFITQARFQIRKILHANCSFIAFKRIIHWAILLELADEIISRLDYRTIRENVGDVYKQMLLFYEHLQNQQVHKGVALALHDLTIEDEWLAQKAQAIAQMTNFFMRKGLNATIVEQLYASRPYDYLIAQLYAIEHPSAMSCEKWIEYFGDLEKGVKKFKYSIPSKPTEPTFHVTFLGGGEKIGGTAIVVEAYGHAILLDAGMFLNDEQLLTNFHLLQQRGLTLAALDAVFVSHAHLDHTGSLPFVHSEAPNVPIFSTKETKKLMHVLLTNVAANAVNCPYNTREINALYNHMTNLPIGETVQCGPWRVTFYEAGHITGAVSIDVEINGKSLFFTGDISVQPQQTCGTFQFPKKQVDVLITESTYGYLPHAGKQPAKEEQRLFVDEVERTTTRGGCCLVPTFAVGRAQEVLSVLQQKYDGYFPFDVIIDGAVDKICDIYEGTPYFELAESVMNGRDYYKPHTFKRFAEQSSKGSVVIASSGMLNEGSTSSKYAYECIDDPKSAIIFTGYLDSASPAYDIYKQGTKRFKIERENWKEVRAKMTSFQLSAHISRDDLLKVIMQMKPRNVILMHGEHNKRFSPIQSNVAGEVIYPSIVEMLAWASVPTICATNETTYVI